MSNTYEYLEGTENVAGGISVFKGTCIKSKFSIWKCLLSEVRHCLSIMEIT